MRQPVRSFAIGLFTAGIIMLIGFYFFDTSTKHAEDLSANTMIPLIEAKGYHVLTEEEYISVSVNKDNANQQAKAADKTTPAETVVQSKDTNDAAKDAEKEKEDKTINKEDTKDKQDKKEEVKNYTLNIKSGMLSSDISEALEDNHIIKDARKFNSYLKKHKYELKVQLGKFKLNSDMTFNEIAQTITK